MNFNLLQIPERTQQPRVNGMMATPPSALKASFSESRLIYHVRVLTQQPHADLISEPLPRFTDRDIRPLILGGSGAEPERPSTFMTGLSKACASFKRHVVNLSHKLMGATGLSETRRGRIQDEEHDVGAKPCRYVVKNNVFTI